MRNILDSSLFSSCFSVHSAAVILVRSHRSSSLPSCFAFLPALGVLCSHLRSHIVRPSSVVSISTFLIRRHTSQLPQRTPLNFIFLLVSLATVPFAPILFSSNAAKAMHIPLYSNEWTTAYTRHHGVVNVHRKITGKVRETTRYVNIETHPSQHV